MRRNRNLRLAVVACIAVLAAIFLWPRIPRVAARALTTADEFELLSIEPERSDSPSPADFHRHKVLGSTLVSDPGERLKLINALRSGVEPFYTNVPKCFSPRLGIRVVSNGETTECVICFGCRQAQVFRGDQVVAGMDHEPSAQSGLQSGATGGSHPVSSGRRLTAVGPLHNPPLLWTGPRR